jgi:hypothetical protein
VYENEYFLNKRDQKVLEVHSGQDEEGAKVGVAKKEFKIYQKWKVTYVKDAEAAQTTGLYKPFGLHFARPFYIRSRMPM